MRGALRHRAARAVARAARTERLVRSWRRGGRVGGSGLRSRSARDRADRTEAGRLRRRARAAKSRRAVLERLRSTPGIDAVAAASVLPFGDYSFGSVVQREGPPVEKRRSRRARQDRARARVHDHVRLLQDDWPDDGARARVHGGRRSGHRRHAARDHRRRRWPSGCSPTRIPSARCCSSARTAGGADAKPMMIVGVAPTCDTICSRTGPSRTSTFRPGPLNPRACSCTRAPPHRKAPTPSSPPSATSCARSMPNLPVIFVRSFRSQHEGSAQVWILRRGGAIVPDARTRGCVRRRGRALRRAQLPGGAAHARVRRAHGGRSLAGRCDAARAREAVDHDHGRPRDWLGPWRLLGWGLSAVIYQISPFDPLTLGGRHRRAGRRLARRFGRSRATRRQRDADDCVAQ